MTLNITNSRFLITGGTGSFGKTMAAYLLEKGAEQITIFSRDEKKQDDMRRILANDSVRFVIGDVRDENSVNLAMKNVNYVFHAAALKQVPSCEFFPMEANKTNVVGSDNVCRAATQNGVQKVVCLSTDKAVYPINAMGISKAFMEKTVLSHSLHRKSETDTKFCITRYGNVMASRGSVIPHFVKQAMAKNELTVTNPNMTRFLMSLQESIELVLYAFNNASSGEICVQKASGTTISNLAHAINERYDNDQPIKIIGARHGEKLHEVLLSSEESSKSKEHGNFYVVPPDERDLNYTKYFSDGTSVMEKQSYTSANTTQLNIEEVKRKIETILKPIEEQL